MSDTSVHLNRQPADVEYVPAGWRLRRLAEISTSIGDGIHSTPKYVEHSRFPFINGNNLFDGGICIFGSTKFVGEDEYMRLRINLSSQTILISINGTIGNLALFQGQEVVLGKSAAYINLKKGISREFVYYYLASRRVSSFFENELTGTTIRNLSLQTLRNTPILLPSSIQEGDQIASVLGDVADLIFSLERLVAKKQAIKQGMMHQLLTGKTRLPGFNRRWSIKSLGEAATILDNLRLPLSADQRIGRNGPYPYCGANGVLDYIDDYMIDDDVVLLAEDGGNFDQFHSRPIAYRMKGKIWVNNHAHVLKAAPGGDTAFLFYSLERKDITPFISSGTRSKLTRGELVRINIDMPEDVEEQKAIAEVLTDIDLEIEALRRRLNKAKATKEGMMRELLTGRTRLPVKESAS